MRKANKTLRGKADKLAARAELKAKILELATQKVMEDGEDYSLRQLAADAGTSTTAIYTFFGGRNGLEMALFERSFEIFLTHVSGVKALPDPLEQLYKVSAGYRQFAVEYPAAYALVFSGRLKFERISDTGMEDFDGLPSPTANGLQVYSVFSEAVEACQREGILDDRVKPYVLVDLLWCQLHGCVMLEQAGYGRNTEDNDQRYQLGMPAIVDGMRKLSALD